MKNFTPAIDVNLIERLKKNYFFDPNKTIHLKKGEPLLLKDDKNNKLFFITQGAVGGFLKDDFEHKQEIFRAEENMFVGVNSFFSSGNVVYANVIAIENTTLLYITKEDVKSSIKNHFFDDFLPLILHELSLRQQFSRNIMIEKESALKKLYENDKMAMLGQMSAGLAHELNNTAGVINGNINWLSDSFYEHIKTHESSDVLKYYQKGVEDGQKHTSEEIRKLKEEISNNYDIPASLAKKTARIGLDASELKNIKKKRYQKKTDQYFRFWQIGVAVHDILLASNHSTHILKSIKQLSSTDSERFEVDINASIHEALTLLKKRTQGITVSTTLNDLPSIMANKGELVQVWINIIKNACESINSNQQNEKKLHIVTLHKLNTIQINIRDNGGGISKENIEKIFRPNFTTKKGGLSFGLGLGLSIVQRIINSYDGTINVKSENSETTFKIILPIQ